MRLEDVTAEIRPRGQWESIDLGCALVRESYGVIMAAWFSVVVPMWLGIIALSQLWPWPEGRPWMALLGCWLMLPLVDRVPLFVLSRALFGVVVSGWDVVRASPKLMSARWLSATLFRRLSMSRGLSMPVAELEGLKGKAYRDRVVLLSRNGGEGVSKVLFIGVMMVLATMFSALFIYWGLMGLLGEEVVVEEFWTRYVLNVEADFIPIPYVWVLVVLYLMGVTLVEPFVVGAGFSMYINSRTITEGWDVELAFKRLNKRIRAVVGRAGVMLGILMVVICGGLAEPVSAGNEKLAKVLADEDFIVHEKIEQIPIKKEVEAKTRSVGMWGGGEVVLWLVLVSVVAVIVHLIIKNKHVLNLRFSRSGEKEHVPKVRSVMGMEVAPECLPDDVVAAARLAWREGDAQLSLSLLYRGAIAWMVNEVCLPITESDTEKECLAHFACLENRGLYSYFSKLTDQWMLMAYGNQLPSEEELAALCDGWPFVAGLMERGEVR